MRRIYALIILILPVLFTKLSYAQTGELQGKIIDAKTKQGIPFANVVLFSSDVQKGGAQTDINGNFVIKPLDAGTYTLKVSYVGYQPAEQTGIVVNIEKITTTTVSLSQGEGVKLKQVIVSAAAPPLVQVDQTTTGTTIGKDQIGQMATRGLGNEIANTAGVTQTDEGGGININGGRSYSSKVYVDGIPVFQGSSSGLPTSGIEQITVITGGIPAKYGDVTSGVINVTTRGPSKEYNGGINLETSEGLDPYGYNLAAFNLSGPIYTKYKKTDSAQAKVGFFISAQVENAKNGSFGNGGNSAPAFDIYTVKPGVLANIEQNPLQPAPSGTGFVPTAESLTPSDLETSSTKIDVPNTTYTFSGKLNFQFTKNLNLLVGSSLDYQDYYDYNYAQQLLDPENQTHQTNLTYRGFARFTQLFNSGNGNNGSSVSVFQNGYYSVQASYSNSYTTLASEQHGSDLFDYGYLGKFQDYNEPTYSYGYDTVSKKVGWIEGLPRDTLIRFTPSTENPLLANYTTQYYALAGNTPAAQAQYYSNLDQIQAYGGLLNGQNPTSVYSMWTNVGTPENGYGYVSQSQIEFDVNGSVDIVNPKTSDKDKKKDKGRHAIEFGITYQQKDNKEFEVFPQGLWSLMQQLTDPTATMKLDTKNPLPVYNQYGVYQDTVKYNLVNTSTDYFNGNLRQKLGLSQNQSIYINELAPSTFSLNMFSPDELANNGSFYEIYWGYNYLGQSLSTQPKFNDFFTQVGSNGQYTRNNPAFQPNYSAAYIQDKFRLNDIIFNVGLRVDRYDANQEELIDPYLLYPARTASEVNGTIIGGQQVTTPTGIAGNDVVYVDNATAPTKILGYRNGNQWYLSNGQATSDPGLIAQQSSTGSIQPYLVSTSSAFPALTGSSFTNYTPQINVMPRIAFSFPISDEVMFFAHYDVLTQRPDDFTGGTLTGDDVTSLPEQYYYLKQLTTDYLITNPALKPEQTIDYQVGYQQALGKNSAITISMLYRDLKDQVEVYRYVYAYPYDYNTFGNVDFGTVKSLLLTYEMRRTKNIQLTLNYTLSFAEGTGSSATSSYDQLSESNPNLQVITPFSYDQRHTISGNLDYRYGEGQNYDGPIIGGKQILKNFGVNLLGEAFSGVPYTAQSNPTPTVLSGVVIRPALKGDINGSRLPWSYRLNLKVDKAFGINVGKSKNNANGRNVYCDIYLLLTNVLNAQNVLSVYSYTGNAGDDGYLESAIGKQYVSTQDFPSSFSNLYQIRVDNPSNYSQPRTIHLGATISF